VKCRYCAAPATSRDHIIPKEWGGRDRLWWDDTETVRNVAPSCVPCNRLRGECGHCVGAMAAMTRLPPWRRDAAMPAMRQAAKAIARPRWLWWEVSA